MTPSQAAAALRVPDRSVPTPPAARALVLVGNPNVGKSVVFGALTGRYVTVSNYPGTTVEIGRGTLEQNGERWRVLDTPGTSGLVPLSEDEAVTRDLLLSEGGALVVQVCDAKNLRRGLLLSAQLAEAGLPFVLCLNMADEASQRGVRVDGDELGRLLGIPIVRTVAIRGEGLPALRDRLARASRSPQRVFDPAAVEDAIGAVVPLLPPSLPLSARAVALMCLAGGEEDDPTLWSRLRREMTAADYSRLRELRADAAARAGEPIRLMISRSRSRWADSITSRVLRKDPAGRARSAARWLEAAAVHPILSLPMLAIVLLVGYEFVGVFGAGTLVNLLERTVFGRWIVPATEWLVRAVTPAGAVQQFLVGPAGSAAQSGGLLVGRYGLVSMALSYGIAIVLPIVATFFLYFSVLEDSGYLPRIAVVLNRLFRALGLNGKAVLPMVLGLGCDTMATMTTRILETRKERILVTLLLALGVPCSAQLGVILGMLSGLSLTGALWWGGSVAGTVLLVGWLAAKVVPGERSDFLLEIPPVRRPLFSNIAIKTLARVEWYLREALPLFVIGTGVLWLMDRFGLVSLAERVCSPIVAGVLGLPRQATGAFIIGFLRRDYGAAGLFALFHPAMLSGALPRETEIQLVVSMVTITLFIPCLANFLVIVKERGWRTGLAIAGFIFPFSVAVGGLVNLAMRHL